MAKQNKLQYSVTAFCVNLERRSVYYSGEPTKKGLRAWIKEWNQAVLVTGEKEIVSAKLRRRKDQAVIAEYKSN